MELFRTKEEKIREANRELLEGAKAGDIKAVASALKNGADVNTSRSGMSSLMRTENTQLKATKMYDAGVTALMHATVSKNLESKNLEMMELLVSRGADVNQKDIYGQTPLMYAMSEGTRKVVLWLLEHGADVDERDFEGTPVRDFASEELWSMVLNYKKGEIAARAQNIALADKQKVEEIVRELEEN